MSNPTKELAAAVHYEELANVVKGYPLWPGDTLSHATARFIAELGWIKRNTEGCWYPTPRGIKVHKQVTGK